MDTPSHSASWQTLLEDSVTSPEALEGVMDIDASLLKRASEVYPMHINPYFLDLACKKGTSLLGQVIPNPLELQDSVGVDDPLAEERDSPVPNVVHRYPDRVLFLVSDVCGVYCRFCTRKRRIGRGDGVSEGVIQEGVRYIREHNGVKDVLLSGGDPLLLPDERLDWILSQIRDIPHVEIIRIGTRVPSVLPQRVTSSLINVLKKYHPLFVNTHFNHPDELSKISKSCLGRLIDARIPLGNQTVLLRGINDDSRILIPLMRSLLKERVRPYYLHHADLTKGTHHFRTSIETGLRIMEQLRGHVSGMAVPTYVVDLPGGRGKVPLIPQYVKERSGGEIVFRNYRDEHVTYPDVTG